MSTVNSLEQNGNLSDFPAVELLREAVTAGLSGSFRFAQDPQKIVVYLDGGEVVFAASNLRGHRFTVKLVQWQFVQEQDLANLQNLPDPEIGAKLIEAGKLTPVSLEMCQMRHVAEIISTALLWTEGEWTFTPFVRVRDELRVAVDIADLLVEAGRKLPADLVASRFADETDSFAPVENAYQSFNMSPEEAYLLSRVDGVMSLDMLSAVSGLPEAKIKPSVYLLWLGGLVRRFNAPAAFDEEVIKQLQTAKITSAQVKPSQSAVPPVVKPESLAKKAEPKPQVVEAVKQIAETPPAPILSEEDALKAVEKFLARIESSKTHYQILDISQSSLSDSVKQTYFKLAKQFHPDKFHHLAGSETHTRLQNAFNKLSQAYETLKDIKSRELYDFKLKKEGIAEAADVSKLSPAEVFRQGMETIQKGNYNEGVALLTRAVQLAPDAAEYHARLGQALSANQKFRHQAEAELQTAIRLDARNADWRMALITFFIENGMNKRAENELKKLLEMHPNHNAARQMLSNMR